MSKNKSQASDQPLALPSLPGIESGVTTTIETAAQVQPNAPSVLNPQDAIQESDGEVVTSQPFMAIVEAPLASIDPTAYIQVRERLEAKEMSRKQSIALKRLHRGLEDKGARLEDGSLITRPAQAVRWLLEQIYNASN